ncbi:hypothetical protein CAL7716_025780 [Calothrix sp. PCC 7716]|nr:hypothetical protein CAL7716_025780 [Calothrix sp. PCC 7716]
MGRNQVSGFFIETEIKTTIMGRNQVSGFYKKAEAPLEEISSYPLLYKFICYTISKAN